MNMPDTNNGILFVAFHGYTNVHTIAYTTIHIQLCIDKYKYNYIYIIQKKRIPSNWYNGMVNSRLSNRDVLWTIHSLAWESTTYKESELDGHSTKNEFPHVTWPPNEEIQHYTWLQYVRMYIYIYIYISLYRSIYL